MTLSIVIPAYNCLEPLKHTLVSLERQDIPREQFEVVVVDDGSSDGTREFLRAYRGALDFKVIYNERNLGRAKTRNVGIFSAKNDIVVFIDADVEVAPFFLKTHLENQQREKAVYVGIRPFHPDIPRNGVMRYLEKRGAGKYKKMQEIPGRYLVSCNASVPREVLLNEGGFDERFIHYGGEDLELGLRLAQRLNVRSLPSAIGYHRHHRALEEFLELTKGFGEHSLPLIFSKHPGIARELGFDNFPPKTLRDYFIRFACNEPIFQVMKLLGKFAFMPAVVYNYLIFRSYRKGFRDQGSGIRDQSGRI
jgi:glycosyltransferase involved in cell wall biosynthesis